MYEFTCQLAALGPTPPDILRLQRALVGNQPEIDRFLGLIAGATSIPDYFTPENLGRILGASS